MRYAAGLTHLVALGSLTAVALGYVWPLLTRFTSALPGGPADRDVATMVWNVSWVHHALHGDGLPRSLLWTADVLVPFGADLRLHTYGLLQGLLAEPFVGLLGVVGAFNLNLAATLILNGGLSYLLVLRETRSGAAALVAATCFMLASPVLAQLRVGRPSFGAVWLVVAALLAADWLLHAPRWWKGALLGAALLGALLADLQIAFFAAIWLAMLVAARLRRLRAVAPLGLSALVAGLPFLSVYYPAFARADTPRPTLDDTLPYSYRLADYVDPAVIPYAYGFDLLAGALAALLLFRWRGGYRLWLLGGLGCLLLALGPALQPTSVPLPFAALGLWPPLAQFRTPSRLTMPAALGLAVALGYALAPLFRRVPSWIGMLVLSAALLGRLLYAQAHDPFAVQTYPTYAAYNRLAREPGRFVLLEVPFGVRSGLERIGDGGEILEHYQHVHGKPLLNGMIARLPASVFAEYAGHPSLLLLSGGDVAESVPSLQADLADVIDWTGSRYVLVHHAMLDAEQAGRIDSLLDSSPLLERVGQEADLVVYAVRS